MGTLSQFGRFIGNLFELIAMAITGLIYAAIWAAGFVIDLATDILGWINDKLDELLGKGTSEVNVIQGGALGAYLIDQKQRGNNIEVSYSQINAMRNSVINVALDECGNIIDDQMIRSEGGLSVQSEAQFQGQPILTIKMRE